MTRDTRLVRRRDIGAYCFIRCDRVQDQLRQLAAEYDLDPNRAQQGTRCLRCNVKLERMSREAAAGRVPLHVWQTQDRFTRCPRCGRIYWPGTHWERMAEMLAAIRRSPSASQEAEIDPRLEAHE